MPIGGGVLPTTVTGVCTLDASNSDPAVLYFSSGGGVLMVLAHVLHKCTIVLPHVRYTIHEGLAMMHFRLVRHMLIL